MGVTEWLIHLLETFSIWDAPVFLSHSLFGIAFSLCTNCTFRERKNPFRLTRPTFHMKASYYASGMLAFLTHQILSVFCKASVCTLGKVGLKNLKETLEIHKLSPVLFYSSEP